VIIEVEDHSCKVAKACSRVLNQLQYAAQRACDGRDDVEWPDRNGPEDGRRVHPGARGRAPSAGGYLAMPYLRRTARPPMLKWVLRFQSGIIKRRQHEPRTSNATGPRRASRDADPSRARRESAAGCRSGQALRRYDGQPEQGRQSYGQPPDPDRVMVRARVRQHLDRLKDRFPDQLGSCDIAETRKTDYRYRLFVAKPVWCQVLSALAGEMDYDNFKSEVAHFQKPAGGRVRECLARRLVDNAPVAEKMMVGDNVKWTPRTEKWRP
jgi:hypothetical protein